MSSRWYTVLYWPEPVMYAVAPSSHLHDQSRRPRVPYVVRRRLSLVAALKLAHRLNLLRDGVSE